MTITVAYDFEQDCYRLYASNYNRTEVAGPRILRGPPHPEIAYEHDTEAAAQEDARKLQAYLDNLPVAKKRKSTAKNAHQE